MKIVCVSDTHGWHDALSIPEGDVLIHSGDATMMGRPDELIKFNLWLAKQNFAHKLFIPGNHDWLFEKELANALSIMTAAKVLIDESITIKGIKIYGAPWQPRFFDWAFNVDRGAPIAEKWARIPEDTDILVTHGPPFGILDATESGEKVGCRDLLKRVNLVQPKYHIFGHIHGQHGVVKRSKTTFINASSLSERYRPAYKAVTFEIV